MSEGSVATFPTVPIDAPAIDPLKALPRTMSELPDFKSRICTMVPTVSRSAFSRGVRPC